MSADVARTAAEAPERPELPELEAYGDDQRRRGCSPVTIRARARVVTAFARWLGRPLKAATVADLRAFVASRRPHLAEASQATEISYLKSFYAALLELGWVAADPAEGLKSWRADSPRRPLSLLAVRALLLEASRVPGRTTPVHEALALRDRACLELLFATGVRSSELCAARVVDLDLEDASALVRRAKTGPSRRLPLPAPAVAALRRYLEEGRPRLLGAREDPGALFLSHGGAGLTGNALGLLVRRVGERCGVAVHPHLFRRTIATELAHAKVSLPAIQRILGHASLTVTSEYVSVGVEHMRAALEELVRGRPAEGPDSVGSELDLQRRLFAGWKVRAA